MNKTWIILIFFASVTVFPSFLTAQEIEKSEVIELIDGKQYYIHAVEEGQTLFSIAKAYNTSVDELEFENPDAGRTLAIGQILKIPVTSREQKIREELKDEDFRYIFHIVKKGETLYGISRIYEVDVNALKAANPDWDKGLKTGQYVKVPLGEPAPPETKLDVLATHDGLVHTVRAGETLYSISRKFQVGIPLLKAANKGLDGNLSVGQRIVIPQTTPPEEEKTEEKKYFEHIVKPQETLYGIAKRYRTSLDSLKGYNPGLSVNIFPGEVIRIPLAINPKDYITHRVKEKTKIKKIASKYAMSVSIIKDANPEIGNRVYPGDLLKVPVGPPPVEKPDEPEETIPLPNEDLTKVEMSDSVRCYQNTPFSSRQPYKIALMIPLYTEEARKLSSNDENMALDPSEMKPFNFIQFYEGFLMALEKEIAHGQEVRLYVYDVDEKVSKTIKVLQEPALKDMDLIIGPFFRRNFKLVSNFAEMFNIMIVNPLTRRTEVLSNPNVIKMKPSIDKQPSILARFIEKYHPEANVILIRNNKFQYSNIYDDLRSRLEKVLPYGIKIPNRKIYDLLVDYSKADTNLAPGILYDHIMIEQRKMETIMLENALHDSTFFTNGIAEVNYSADSVDGIIRNASVARKNIVIVLSNNEVFVPEVLTRLNDLKDTFDISVVGMPEWELLDNLEIDYLLDLDVHFFTDAYYDPKNPRVRAFVENFRERYKTQPDNFAFEAYDLGTYFMGAINNFGNNCRECLAFYRANTLKSRFIIKSAYPSGFENLYWNFCRYRNYTIYKFPDDDFNQIVN